MENHINLFMYFQITLIKPSRITVWKTDGEREEERTGCGRVCDLPGQRDVSQLNLLGVGCFKVVKNRFLL